MIIKNGFISLTKLNDKGEPGIKIFVNTNNIAYISGYKFSGGDNDSYYGVITLVNGDELEIPVKETPSEIMSLISERFT